MPHGVRRRALGLGLACAGVLLLAGTAIAGNGGIAPEPPVSPGASSIRESYWFVLGFTAVVFFGVEGALILFIAKYRRGKRPRNQDGLQIHGSTRPEIIWTVVPVLVPPAIGSFFFLQLAPVPQPPAPEPAPPARGEGG